METYWVYILYSRGSDRYYVGQTHDVAARLRSHNEGARADQSTKYTFKHRPWELVCSFSVGADRGEAMKIEKYIKRQKSRSFLERVIACVSREDWDELAQLVRVPACRD